MTMRHADPVTSGLMPPRLAELAHTTMVWGSTSTGSANAQTISPEFPLLSLSGHPSYAFIAGFGPTAVTTLTVGAFTATVRRSDGAALVGNEWVAGGLVIVIYDGTYWRHTNPASVSSAAVSSTTFNASDKDTAIVLYNGNLSATVNTKINRHAVRCISAIPTGYWYAEFQALDLAGGQVSLGIATASASLTELIGNDANGWGYDSGGTKRNSAGSASASGAAFGSAYGTGARIGVAVATPLGRLWFRRDGVWQASGDPSANSNPAFTGLAGSLYLAASFDGLNAGMPTVVAVPSASQWRDPAPVGFSALP